MFEQTAVANVASEPHVRPRVGIPVPLDTVASPGAYICNWSGHLLRVPEQGFLASGPLAVNIVGGQPLTVTKISENPDLPLSEARGRAWTLGLSVRF